MQDDKPKAADAAGWKSKLTAAAFQLLKEDKPKDKSKDDHHDDHKV